MGKAGTPQDGRRNNGHFAKAGAGRPRINPADSKARGIHQIRAYDDEFKLIRRFIALVRKDKKRCADAVAILEINDDGGEAK